MIPLIIRITSYNVCYTKLLRHDYRKIQFPLLLKPIKIGKNVWVCSEAFVGPGVTINDGAVLGARAVAKKDLKAWCVYDGNPCKKMNIRNMDEHNES